MIMLQAGTRGAHLEADRSACRRAGGMLADLLS
jgi:hypothetical protein